MISVPCKDQSFTRILEPFQHRFEVWRRVEVLGRVFGNNPVKVSRNVCISNRTQNVLDRIVGAKVNFIVLEELNRIGNQAALRHTKQVIQGLEP